MTLKHVLAGLALAGGLAALAPQASAGVNVGIGIGVGGPGYYGTYAVRTGPCYNPRWAYNHPWRCGYPRYSEPVFIDGVWVREPLYWRTYGNERYFWWHGGWRVGHGDWDGHRWADRDDRRWHDGDRDRDEHWRDRDDHRDGDRDEHDRDRDGGDRDRDGGDHDHDRDHR
ncbi:MAG: hypothetical protein JOZ13_06355 [Alphaproteobacteria bacterium]|nr:hypothetical protein [Alphaproteobacteria bacterium]